MPRILYEAGYPRRLQMGAFTIPITVISPLAVTLYLRHPVHHNASGKINISMELSTFRTRKIHFPHENARTGMIALAGRQKLIPLR